ncbi:MAG: hypothetical protein DMG06_03255, partial [Acidobacteria bacterium]
ALAAVVLSGSAPNLRKPDVTNAARAVQTVNLAALRKSRVVIGLLPRVMYLGCMNSSPVCDYFGCFKSLKRYDGILFSPCLVFGTP